MPDADDVAAADEDMRLAEGDAPVDQLGSAGDDEERVVKGLSPHGDGAAEVVDTLSEVGAALLVAIGKLDKARK